MIWSVLLHIHFNVVLVRFESGRRCHFWQALWNDRLKQQDDILAPLDSLMYPVVYQIVSLAFGASCTSFLLALKSVHVTEIGTRRGHRWPGTRLALLVLCHAGRVRARIASTVLASRAMVACHRATATPATTGLGHAAAR